MSGNIKGTRQASESGRRCLPALARTPILPACSSSPRQTPPPSDAAFEQHGEFSAAVELRRLFPAITDTVQARACARTIAGWKPLPVPLRPGDAGTPEETRSRPIGLIAASLTKAW